MEIQGDNRYEQPDVFMQRGTALYSTLPCRKAPKVYQEEPETYRRYSPQNVSNYQGNTDNYGFNSLPRRQIYPRESDNTMINRNFAPTNSMVTPKTQNVIQNQVPFNARNRQIVNFQSSTPNKEQTNPSKVPMGISNFFSPIRKQLPVVNNESLRISPIEPCNSGKFQSSTPQKPINSAINLSNKLLSPKKSTMSNEELYAVIHRSKKKLNIKTDFNNPETPTPEQVIPKSNDLRQPETGYLAKPQTRSSWSPNNDELSKSVEGLSINPGSRQSWACNDRLGTKKTTSRLDFKKLLLQQNSKAPAVQTPYKKLSAVEQLRLTKDQPVKKMQSPLQIADLSASPKTLGKKFTNGPSDYQNTSPEKQRPPPKIMSPRSTWRFANPRSDVLSSTILEDCREDETSNSSNELISSPRNQSNGQVIQSSVAYCNAVSDASKRAFMNNQFVQNDYKINKPETYVDQKTRNQYIQARRDAYFNIHPSSNVKNNRDSPPTLETAL